MWRNTDLQMPEAESDKKMARNIDCKQFYCQQLAEFKT